MNVYTSVISGIMNDFDLVNLPLRELNKRLRALPKQMAYNMKKRRRTLKNRKYAQNCRSKRLEQKSEMEIQNHHLKSEISRLGRVIEKFKNEVATLRVAISNKNNSDHQVIIQKKLDSVFRSWKLKNNLKDFILSASSLS